jgi:beta-lactamase regulating signal transducer with metallopeptidase domain
VDLLIEWCWRGTLLAVGVPALIGRWPRASATTRYQVGWLTLAAVLMLPLAHALPEVPSGADRLAPATSEPARSLLTVEVIPGPLVLGVLAAWMLWSLRGIVALVLALAALRRVRRACRPFPADVDARLTTWRTHRDRARRTRLMLADEVSTASVFGLWSPIVAVSPAIVARLEPDELDRIVTHELAHVVRRDDWAEFVQAIVRALVGWHPGVWWLDRRLRAEREAACDDWVVALTGGAVPYAASLVKLADLRQCAAVPLPLAPGAVSRSLLTARVTRLLDRRRNQSIRGSRLSMAGAATLALLLSLQLSSIDLVAAAPTPDAPASIETPVPAPDGELPTPVRDTARAGGSPRDEAPSRVRRPRARPPGRMPLAAPPITADGPFDDAIAQSVPQSSDAPDAVAPTAAFLGATPLGSRTPATLPGALPSLMPQAADGPRGAAAPWTAVADGGVAIGEGSSRAAVATARFFTRMSKSIAGAF